KGKGLRNDPEGNLSCSIGLPDHGRDRVNYRLTGTMSRVQPMTIHVALLRGINVGGHNKVAMSDLRDLLGDLGFSGVTSLLQSGNLVFKSDRWTGAALERLLEKETAERVGVSTEYVVRNAEEWKKIVNRNPFPKEAKDDPSHLLVLFLKAAPAAKDMDALRAS